MRTDLLGRDIECDDSHVHFSVVINTRQDEEDSWTSSSTLQTTEAEDDGSLVLLDDLDGEEETEGEGDEDGEEGEEGDEASADTRPVRKTVCSINSVN